MIILPFILTGIVIYWYLNPSIDDEDFHLENFLSDPNKNFYNERNSNFSKKEYTYNNETYYNNNEKYNILFTSIIIFKPINGCTKEKYRYCIFTKK